MAPLIVLFVVIALVPFMGQLIADLTFTLPRPEAPRPQTRSFR